MKCEGNSDGQKFEFKTGFGNREALYPKLNGAEMQKH